MFRIESLLSARLFVVPKVVGDRIYFISNLSGRLSLYSIAYGGSIPQPLLPPHLALQNPHLIGGKSFEVFPKLGKLLVMVDRDGDEHYQPVFVPIDGGFPEPAFAETLRNYRVGLALTDVECNLVYLSAGAMERSEIETYRGNLETGELELLFKGPYGAEPAGHSRDHRQVALVEGYQVGDAVIYLWEQGRDSPQVLYGTPLDQRQPDQSVSTTEFLAAVFTPSQKGLVVLTPKFTDTYSLAVLDLVQPQQLEPVEVRGVVHRGAGEMDRLEHLRDDRYLVGFNIDGASWLYEGVYDESTRQMVLRHLLVGQGGLAAGVIEAVSYDEAGDRFALSFSTATSPTQIYTIEGPDRSQVVRHTDERLLGLPQEYLASGEDASFTSFDGTRVSARLYLPAEKLGFTGPRPLVYYVHGGPQSQERPDFAWFSIPLIQYLTMRGFAVFVPNVRGSTGYGLSYTKHVDRDWGGKDVLDHVAAIDALKADPRVDTNRAGVVGRSYGGYMSLTLAGRHPELWSAAVDMFGPFDLLTFSERIPETWKPYFRLALGDPEKDHDFLVERSPRTHLDHLACPLLVIQGKNDPRVVEAESRDLVEYLRGQGKDVEYLMFENEGHDVLKFENRVTCYNAITDFFEKHLEPAQAAGEAANQREAGD